MRISLVDYKLNLRAGGGSNHTLHLLASHFSQAGHDVRVVTVSPNLNSFGPNLLYQVVEEPHSGPSFSARQRLGLVRTLRKYERETDVFQIDNPSLMVGGALYRLLGGKAPVVVRLNNYGYFCANIALMDSRCYRHCSLRDRLRHWPQPAFRKALLTPFRLSEGLLTARLVNKIDAFIAVSPAVADIYCLYGLNPEKMEVITAPVDYETMLVKSRQTPCAPPQTGDPLRVLYVGRLAREKGVDILLRAVAGLDFATNVRIVGDGPERASLQELAAGLGLADRVEFCGWVPNETVPDFYLWAHVFVHPGRWPEPSGRGVVEAMSLGIPAIVSDIGGPPWLLGENGLTFRPEDPNHLREKLETVRAQSKRVEKLAARAQARAEQFDCARVGEQFLDVYSRVRGVAHSGRRTPRASAAEDRNSLGQPASGIKR